ncbi:sigma-70 family RNA polymerase sigma factor [Robiginitomaculum antarcticum]|uniref:sigma-70 family RNA polymerase sigma factor n=1 Tax=Robiginitomaculum antarcticum TaxID=437507 RepID=UPI00036CC9E1|nr:sigma-70 family RNA polymerase sigma factor [Robiginitomaculum antarcticum]
MTDKTHDDSEETPEYNEDEFRAELTALIPHLRAFSRSLCGNAALADDVAQDALLKAWNARERYRPGSNLKAWTFTILRNQFYSIKRRSWRATSLEPEVAEQTIVATADVEQSVRLNELRRGLDMLQDDQRDALILVGASGLSYEEAAEICDCAVGTIKSRVSRARKNLEIIMDSGHFDGEADGVSALDAMDTILAEAKSLVDR